MSPAKATTTTIPRLAIKYNKDEIKRANNNTLLFLSQCTQEAIQGLHIIKNMDIVISIGNTGAGKSTILNAIVFGKDKLEIKKNGNRLCIDQKPGF